MLSTESEPQVCMRSYEALTSFVTTSSTDCANVFFMDISTEEAMDESMESSA